MTKEDFKPFQEKVIAWYLKEGRVFYWRTHTLSTWQWLFLELLLKRTRAETVEKTFPFLASKYNEPRVITQIANNEFENDLRYLGLYRQRLKALKLIAEKILYEYGGQVPLDPKSLSSLPFVGDYTSNAVLCFGLGLRRALVDSNISRILTRFCGLNLPKDAREKWIWELSWNMLPETKWIEYNFSLIDLGAKVCKNKMPECLHCCLSGICKYSVRISK